MSRSLSPSSPAAGYHPELEKRLEGYRKSDADREQLLRDVLSAYQALEIKYQETAIDLQNEQSSRRQWQARAKMCEDNLGIAHKAQESSPYVTVLIDGDGAPFLDDFYARGEAGGSDAAYQLNEELRKHIANLYPDYTTTHWNVIVNVFVNMEGMSAKLRACNLLPSTTDLHKIGQAFAHNQPLFQFVDVGAGKERADYKLREWFRLSLGNVQCKHIILGGICHDNGYLPMLEPYKHDASTTRRVSILATLPPEPQYRDMSFKPIRIERIFRSEHLPAKPTIQHFENGVNRPLRPIHSLPRDSLDPIVDGISNLGETTSRNYSPAPPERVDSWARVSKANDENTKEINVASKKPAPRKFLLLNKNQERLDPRIAAADKASQDKLYRRIKEVGKVCNFYHLTGKCSGNCGFHHGEKLPEGELNALRLKARTRACTGKSFCRDFDCTFGHVCPYGAQCHGKGCQFEETHDVDMMPSYKWYEDDHIERLTK
ncbi:hypothetical protein K461DRAFT_165208 [Myriangium duriaei CBS 260.36]|uniref:C3H1-type domain-containing protein n=1 Tax=Myriangium duriaei CBS 260.36 TaxID=1168546 RepID=A0A9P4MEC5_9PEZI|nr:hypothetical protein K461DRAFT_165208 [Myriangium duriaei CBS 260.36]